MVVTDAITTLTGNKIFNKAALLDLFFLPFILGFAWSWKGLMLPLDNGNHFLNSFTLDTYVKDQGAKRQMQAVKYYNHWKCALMMGLI